MIKKKKKKKKRKRKITDEELGVGEVRMSWVIANERWAKRNKTKPYIIVNVCGTFSTIGLLLRNLLVSHILFYWGKKDEGGVPLYYNIIPYILRSPWFYWWMEIVYLSTLTLTNRCDWMWLFCSFEFRVFLLLDRLPCLNKITLYDLLFTYSQKEEKNEFMEYLWIKLDFSFDLFWYDVIISLTC